MSEAQGSAAIAPRGWFGFQIGSSIWVAILCLVAISESVGQGLTGLALLAVVQVGGVVLFNMRPTRSALAAVGVAVGGVGGFALATLDGTAAGDRVHDLCIVSPWWALALHLAAVVWVARSPRLASDPPK